MNWKKKTLLAVATALVGVAASASAEGLYTSPQTTSYYDHSDGYYARYDNRYNRYDSRFYGRDHDYRRWSHRGGWNRGYDDYRGYFTHAWNGYGNSYSNGYGQQDRGYQRHDRDDD